MSMQNVEAKIDGNILTLKVDVSKSLGQSKSGKSNLIGTTGGTTKLGGVSFGLNVFKPVSPA